MEWRPRQFGIAPAWPTAKTNERIPLPYLPEDFLPLEEARQLELLDGDTEVLKGLWVRPTGGHTAGHQMVYLESEGMKAAWLGDVPTTPQHQLVYHTTALDMYPLETVEAKRHWLDLAEAEDWLLIFGHSVEPEAGRLTRQGGQLSLGPVDLPGKTDGEG